MVFPFWLLSYLFTFPVYYLSILFYIRIPRLVSLLIAPNKIIQSDADKLRCLKLLFILYDFMMSDFFCDLTNSRSVGERGCSHYLSMCRKFLTYYIVSVPLFPICGFLINLDMPAFCCLSEVLGVHSHLSLRIMLLLLILGFVTVCLSQYLSLLLFCDWGSVFIVFTEL